MAALTYPHLALNICRPVPGRPLVAEWAAMRAVSRALAQAADTTTGLAGVAQSLLVIPGILSVELLLDDAARWLVPHPHRWGAPDRHMGQPKVSALAPVSAAGQTWGEVRLSLDLGFLAVASPVCLVRFVGQQLGMLLHQAMLTKELATRSRELEAVREQVTQRKIVARATGLLADQHGISIAQAAAALEAQARCHHRDVHDEAERLVVGAAANSTLALPRRIVQ